MWIEPYTTYGIGETSYTSENFTKDVDDLWERVFENYKKLHGYVKWRIQKNREDHGKYIYDDGLIPAHILGAIFFSYIALNDVLHIVC